jgi:hypothetical protein
MTIGHVFAYSFFFLFSSLLKKREEEKENELSKIVSKSHAFKPGDNNNKYIFTWLQFLVLLILLDFPGVHSKTFSPSQ